MISYKYMIPHNNGTAPLQLQQCNNSIFTADQPLDTTPLRRGCWSMNNNLIAISSTGFVGGEKWSWGGSLKIILIPLTTFPTTL